ncbi:MAG TPA: monovalent cation/H+ antiporter complex subunit F [Methanospirillum sp.]|nr:monovalent cation/H+ antiporter complex subunit F [Methanospirillum sp.]
MIEYFSYAALVLVVLMLVSMIRLYLGPSIADRVVAVDAINTMTVAAMILLGVFYKQLIFIDIAIVYALLSFVSTLYIAKYLGGEL